MKYFLALALVLTACGITENAKADPEPKKICTERSYDFSVPDVITMRLDTVPCPGTR